MKTQVTALFLIAFIVPQVVFAAWWNPFSWFGNWNFLKESQQNEEMEILKNKVKELEGKLENKDNVSTSASSTQDNKANQQREESKDSAIKVPVKSTPVTPTPYIPPVLPTVTPNPVSNQSVDANNLSDNFSIRCQITSDSSTIKTDAYINARLFIWEGNQTALTDKYNIVWNSTYDSTSSIEENKKEASFSFRDPGQKNVGVTVTEKSSGISKKDTCSVTVICNRFDCLSERDKKLDLLNDIKHIVDTWFNDSNNLLYHCRASESAIRAFEYQYTLLGGKNIPGFDKEVDCASTLAPTAYKYKISLLIDSI